MNLLAKIILFVLIIVAGIYLFLGDPFLECGHGRSMVSRVKADQRTMATALESYFIDNDSYPAMVPMSVYMTVPEHLAAWKAEDMHTMETGRAGLNGLTTPAAYVTGFPVDPFTNEPSVAFWHNGDFFRDVYDQGFAPFAYYGNDLGWILISPGPDLDYDVEPEAEYDATICQPSDRLILKAYDPTNGVISDGDVFRVKQ